MIRVGFFVGGTDQEWIGGANYMVNLLHAIAAKTDLKIQPVIFLSSAASAAFVAGLPKVEIVRTRMLDMGFKLNNVRKLLRVVFGRDFALEYLLKKNRVQILSHSGHLGPQSPVPTIQWLTDFQHHHLPDLSTPKLIARRDRWFLFACKHATRIVLSSYDAQKDLRAFCADALPKSRVLHFVSGFGAAKSQVTDMDSLQSKYGFSGPYFHLPNQFWAHKNHKVILDALAHIKQRGARVLIICTGHTNDMRHPEYFSLLMESARRLGVEDQFLVLGLVPYSDLVSFMRHAVAVINPSLFEGWSTTVEEAKSLGKLVLLSNIPVHLEQAPDRSIYFDPARSDLLGDAILTTLAAYNPDEEIAAQERARRQLPGRINAFADRYQEIVIDALE